MVLAQGKSGVEDLILTARLLFSESGRLHEARKMSQRAVDFAQRRAIRKVALLESERPCGKRFLEARPRQSGAR